MKKKSSLYFFLFGILFYEIIFPILTEIGNTIVGLLRLLQGKEAVKLAKFNKEVSELKGEGGEEHTSVIGFCVPNALDDEEEEEDDE